MNLTSCFSGLKKAGLFLPAEQGVGINEDRVNTMFDWFSKTFETTARQATLFSITVSTILAVSLLLLNQWFSSRKDKINLRVAKLENFASTIYSYERLCFDILSQIYQQPPSDQATIDKMVKLLNFQTK